MKFKWNLDSTVNLNGVSYTITLPQNTGYVIYKDPLVDIYKIDDQVDSMEAFPQVAELLEKIK